MSGLEKLKSGDFNAMDVECLADGSQIITLHKEGEAQNYRFRVRNLYKPDEQELPLEEP
jgi:hypothetical protein